MGFLTDPMKDSQRMCTLVKSIIFPIFADMYFNLITSHRLRNIILVFYLAILNSYTVFAITTNTDSTRFSLLTCGPGEEIYSLFGHTAIRYEDPTKGIDVVFNYGVFSFNTPNFIYRFVKGETDYMLEVVNFSRFEAEYIYHNRAVWQQTLNLNTEEKKRLFELLYINSQPENKTYRYNFFFDNCSTRPRDKIEESISGKIIYQPIDYRHSYRDIIYEATIGHKWERFGMDFCLGPETDRLMTYREEMFIPFYLMDAFTHAVIIDENNAERPLVSSTTEIISKQDLGEEKPFPLTPIRAALLLFILFAAATIYGIRKKKSLWGIDLILFASAGLAGCVIAFLSCFSEHPAVSPNYLIFVFHPLHVLLLPLFVYREAKGMKSYYHLINTVVLTLFILIWPVNPQHFNLAVLPLALCLLIRSVSNLVLTYKKYK